MPDPTPDLALAEAAAKLDVSVATLNRWVQNGTAPPSFRRGGRRLFPADQLERWLAETRAAAK